MASAEAEGALGKSSKSDIPLHWHRPGHIAEFYSHRHTDQANGQQRRRFGRRTSYPTSFSENE